MRKNLPLIITAILVMAVMLAVAIYSRQVDVGPSRSVQFANALVVNVDSRLPTAVLIEAFQADGSMVPVAWAQLDPVHGTVQVGGVNLPAGEAFQVTCRPGMRVAQVVSGVQTPLTASGSISGGASSTVVLATIPGLAPQPGFSATFSPTPGILWVARSWDVGGTITAQVAPGVGPVPPPAPPEPPAKAPADGEAPATKADAGAG
jgi:hypothetical protein